MSNQAESHQPPRIIEDDDSREDDDDSLFDILEVWDKEEEEEEERMLGDESEAAKRVNESNQNQTKEEEQDEEETSSESSDEDEWTGWNVNEWMSGDEHTATDNNHDAKKEQKVSHNTSPASRLSTWNAMQRFEAVTVEEVMTVGQVSMLGIQEPIPHNATEYNRKFYEKSVNELNQGGIEAILEKRGAVLIDNLRLHYCVEDQRSMLDGRIITTQLLMTDGSRLGVISV